MMNILRLNMILMDNWPQIYLYIISLSIILIL